MMNLPYKLTIENNSDYTEFRVVDFVRQELKVDRHSARKPENKQRVTEYLQESGYEVIGFEENDPQYADLFHGWIITEHWIPSTTTFSTCSEALNELYARQSAYGLTDEQVHVSDKYLTPYEIEWLKVGMYEERMKHLEEVQKTLDSILQNKNLTLADIENAQVKMLNNLLSIAKTLDKLAEDHEVFIYTSTCIDCETRYTVYSKKGETSNNIRCDDCLSGRTELMY